MTRDFQLVCEIKKYSSLQITNSWHGIGIMELHINRYIENADKLKSGYIIFPHNRLNKGCEIKERKVAVDENGKATEDWIITALPLKSWFGQNITMPPEDFAEDSFSGDAESVMHHYAVSQAINPADPNNKLPIVEGSNLGRGMQVEWQSRYKNLAGEMTEVSTLSGIGWNIDIDTENEEFVFNTYEGRDLTANQDIYPPAIFSTDFKTLKELSFVESSLNYKNVAVVAGQGEGIDRRIVLAGDLDAAGLDRHVLFVDARDISEKTDGRNPVPLPPEVIEEKLRNRGLQKLAEHRQELYLEGQVLSKSKLVYGIDYDLGDLVTLQKRDWGVTTDVRITEVKEIYEPGNTGIELTFGNSRPTLISKIKEQLSGMRTEMTR